MRVITLNVNGIRSAVQKGAFEYLKTMQADVICLQEIKAKPEQIEGEAFHLPGYHRYIHSAQKPGYSGVAVYSKILPKAVHSSLGFEVADTEGRYLQLDFNGLSIVSLYLPSGTSGEARQALKFAFMAQYETVLKQQKAMNQEWIIAGDWNIAHTKMDLKNWQSNQKNSGFLPEERAWLDKLFGEIGFVDAFRVKNQSPGCYSWWSHRARAYENDVGWRIDYHVVTPGLKDKISHVFIDRPAHFSDHAPVVVDYDITLEGLEV